MLLPVKGLEIRELPEKCLLLHFKHPIDKSRALDGCPWSFEKNILLLADLKEGVNPMNIELRWWDFFVHIHDIPLNMMNRGVAMLLGNRIGIFRDMEMDAEGCSWGATLRIRVGLDVCKPLKRALMLRSTSGEELLARLTYERLPNFCYLCGHLGHIDKYCELRFSEAFTDPGTETPYGPWLRAPIPIRGRRQVQPHGLMTSLRQRPPPSPVRTGSTVFGEFRTTKNCATKDPQAKSPSKNRNSIVAAQEGISAEEVCSHSNDDGWGTIVEVRNWLGIILGMKRWIRVTLAANRSMRRAMWGIL
ncbi:UNVERIFIED_CONTAM: hypothetical protein Sradi_2351600 [Sesamum radiatum]|uniref:CCHC-type domain-containing protein n=1 Tax=Sesamum radiatum TaxID=300843 RepID=A0AAW2T7E2_SESRA